MLNVIFILLGFSFVMSFGAALNNDTRHFGVGAMIVVVILVVGIFGILYLPLSTPDMAVFYCVIWGLSIIAFILTYNAKLN